MIGYEIYPYKHLENSTSPIMKFIAQLRNQLTATQFIQSFENLASGCSSLSNHSLRLHWLHIHFSVDSCPRLPSHHPSSLTAVSIVPTQAALHILPIKIVISCRPAHLPGLYRVSCPMLNPLSAMVQPPENF